MASKPSNGEITIVIPDLTRDQLKCLCGTRGGNHLLRDCWHLEAYALLSGFHARPGEGLVKGPTLPIPVGATTKTSAPEERKNKFVS